MLVWPPEVDVLVWPPELEVLVWPPELELVELWHLKCPHEQVWTCLGGFLLPAMAGEVTAIVETMAAATSALRSM